MMQQPAPPPPYSVHNQPPIGWAINDIPNEHSAQVLISSPMKMIYSLL
ncbi:unnamed protein product, partial [Rotaria magnacalcarata]